MNGDYNFFSFPVSVNNSFKVGPLVFLVINVCNYGELYETPFTVFSFLYRATVLDIQIIKPTVFTNVLF